MYVTKYIDIKFRKLYSLTSALCG